MAWSIAIISYREFSIVRWGYRYTPSVGYCILGFQRMG